jgi:pSer/pThr/pTyr-binding forkhead associated (FHA) protein
VGLEPHIFAGVPDRGMPGPRAANAGPRIADGIGRQMTTRLIVTMVRFKPGSPIETRIYTESPVSIGRGPNNILRLDHPSVACRHGAFQFTSARASYIDYGQQGDTIIGGQSVAAQTPISLREDTLIEIGIFRICVDLCAVPSDPLVEDKFRLPEDTADLLTFLAVASAAEDDDLVN